MNEQMQKILKEKGTVLDVTTRYFFENKTNKDKKITKKGDTPDDVNSFVNFARFSGCKAEVVEWCDDKGVIVSVTEKVKSELEFWDNPVLGLMKKMNGN